MTEAVVKAGAGGHGGRWPLSFPCSGLPALAAFTTAWLGCGACVLLLSPGLTEGFVGCGGLNSSLITVTALFL